MSDRWLRVDAATCTPDDLRAAAAWLARGHVVAYPTDTFYGLAADPGSADAIGLLFEIKGRDRSVAVPLIAASIEQVEKTIGLARGTTSAQLARTFWPGPLSLVLDAPPSIVRDVHGGRDTVAIRVPAHRVARALAAAFGAPIAATSANLSGAPPAADAGALGALAADPRVLVVDAGATPGGAPSTLVDARGPVPVCVRAGAIAWDRVLTSL